MMQMFLSSANGPPRTDSQVLARRWVLGQIACAEPYDSGYLGRLWMIPASYAQRRLDILPTPQRQRSLRRPKGLTRWGHQLELWADELEEMSTSPTDHNPELSEQPREFIPDGAVALAGRCF